MTGEADQTVTKPKLPRTRATSSDWIGPYRTRSPELAARLLRLFESLEGPNVAFAFADFAIVYVHSGPNRLAILGIDQRGNVEVPWLVGPHKALYKSFAIGLSQDIPNARLYETKTMWRVDGGGMVKGQISVDELLAASATVLEETARIVDRLKAL